MERFGEMKFRFSQRIAQCDILCLVRTKWRFNIINLGENFIMVMIGKHN